MISESGRSPGEGIGYPLQYSGLKNCMECIGHGVAKSRTRLSDFHFQARTLEWVAIPFSRDQACISSIAGRYFMV